MIVATQYTQMIAIIILLRSDSGFNFRQSTKFLCVYLLRFKIPYAI